MKPQAKNLQKPPPRRRSERRVVNTLKQHYRANGYLVTTELHMGYGRADIVGFLIDAQRCRARLENGQTRAIDRIEHCHLLHHIPDADDGVDPIALGELARYMRRSPSFLKHTLLRFLENAGYVRQVGHNLYLKVNGFIPITRDVVAIEAKVSDWRKGAIQAKRYQVFANRVYLAIQHEYAHRVDLDRLRQHRIGLLCVSDSRVYEPLPADPVIPRDPFRHCIAGEWLWRHRRRDIRKELNRASK